MKSKVHKNKPGNLLTIADIYTLSILIIYTVLALIFLAELSNPFDLIIKNISISALILLLAYLHKKHNIFIFRLLHRTYFIAIILVIYNQIQDYIPLINPYLYDDILIKWDKWLFGVNPTEWIYRFSHPVITEYLQIAYFLFYLLPIILAVELYYKKLDRSFYIFTGTILFTFYLSYLMYVFMPAIGPRFTIHEFYMMDAELPGLWLTPYLRDIINSGGAIPAGATNPEAYVNRDCMPSGHTMLTIVTIILAYKNRSTFRLFVLVAGISVIIATVYLRYHYVVDIIAGFILAFPALWLEPKIRTQIYKFNLIRKGNGTGNS